MAFVPAPPEALDHDSPLPFDVFDSHGVLLARKNFLAPKSLLDRRARQGALFTTSAQKDAWDKRVVSAALDMIRREDSTIAKVSTARPRPLDPMALRGSSRAQALVSRTEDTVYQIHSRLALSDTPPFESGEPQHQAIAEVQSQLEQLGNFALVYAHHEIRLRSANQTGALAAYLCLLATTALTPPAEGAPHNQRIAHMIRPQMLAHIMALLQPWLDFLQSPPADQDDRRFVSQRLAVGLGSAVAQSLSEVGFAPEDFAAARQFLTGALGASLTFLDIALGDCLPGATDLRLALHGAGGLEERAGINRIKERHGAFIPGELLLLPSTEIALAYGVERYSRHAKLLRVVNASGLPYLEPLPTRNPQAAQASNRCGNLKVRCAFDYLAILNSASPGTLLHY